MNKTLPGVPEHEHVTLGRIPCATYRLQLHHGFTFDDARKIVPYLARLGISHVYSSPILKARAGSMHGYDVTDHTQLNPELGTREQFDAFIDALHRHQLGLIVDIVPNHLGVMGEDNQWWLDVLENGPAARAAPYFDIDWQPQRTSMRDRILVPILGEPYGNVLEKSELRLEFDAASGTFVVRYYQNVFPIDPREYPRIFAPFAALLDARVPPDDPDHGDFESLMTAFGHLPSRSDTSAESIAIRYRDKEAHKRRLVRLIERNAAVATYVTDVMKAFQGEVGKPASFDALDGLLEAQAYRLAYWRVAVDEINYRRFFDVNDLAALRMNEKEVFDSTHALIFELIDAGKIDGLRIDHSDGLYDPQAYFSRLQERFANENQCRPLYVVTEKILAGHERLPDVWLVHGTTGYEFAALATGWLVCTEEERRITRRYRQFTGADLSFEDLAYRSKKLVMRASLAAEVEVLATQLDRIAQLDRHTADLTRASIREAIIEVIACFPVYRTYISAEGISEEDRRIINWAVGIARKRSPVELTVFDFLRDVLIGDAALERPESHRSAMREFAMKFQQVTSPVTAKGVEDTAFYRFNRLICLNEVGSDPRRFGVSTSAVHQENLERARSWPHAMLASSTHDTKRSEDVRARIAVISELPDLWKLHLSRWSTLNRSRRREIDGSPAPSREDEYMLYQTLAGFWQPSEDPATLIERVQVYLVKAAREAKRATSWITPNEEYEKALCDFATGLLDNPERNAFLRDFASFAATVEFFGALNSLVQTALKLTSPGVPDVYQGTERLSFALVDPDNRRPVDYHAAAQLLDRIEGQSIESIASDVDAAKLFVTWKLLQLRKNNPELFASGKYQPLQIEGDRSDHLIAFARTCEERSYVVVLPRWCARLKDGAMELPLGEATWGALEISVPVPGTLRDVFSEKRFELREAVETRKLFVADVLSGFPLSVLISEG